MRILIIHQPYPMGNYKLSEALGKKLHEKGHEVILLHQLNMSQIDAKNAEEYKNSIDAKNQKTSSDRIYFHHDAY